MADLSLMSVTRTPHHLCKKHMGLGPTVEESSQGFGRSLFLLKKKIFPIESTCCVVPSLSYACSRISRASSALSQPGAGLWGCD